MSNLKTFDTLDDAIIQLNKFCQGKDYRAEKVVRDIYPARYDHSPILNIAKQVEAGAGFTDRQHELAVKLVVKYRRQWKKLGYDVSNINLDTPVKDPIRHDVDRTHRIDVSGNKIIVKFPFKPKLITMIYEHQKQAFGKTDWNKPAKQWELAVTAENTYWANRFAVEHKFSKSEAFTDLVKQVDAAFDYKSIQLDIVGRKLVLHNAPETMLDWIHRNIGRIEMRNFKKIVAAANLLAITLSDEVAEYIVRNYPNLFRVLLQRQSHINPSVESLNDLMLKVKQLDYDNVVFFISDQSEKERVFEAVKTIMPNYHVWTDFSVPLANENKDDNKKITITNKIGAGSTDLIITFAGFMASQGRKAWFNNAVKIIYYCPDLDHTIKKIIKKDESNFNNKRRNKC
jgi:hypothetical protein